VEDATSEAGIRVLLALPPLLADLVQDILERDLSTHVTGRLDATPDLSLEQTIAAARESRAQVVLLGVRRGRIASFCDALLDERPRIKILSIDEDGRAGTMNELTPHATPLGPLWPEGLLDAIRAAAAHTWVGAWPG